MGLVLLLVLAWLLPDPGGLGLSARAPGATRGITATLAAMPPRPVVVVGFDPDIGTYPEIRAATRALLGELLDRDARLVLLNLTPEGRALLLAEIRRLRAAAADASIVDLGFIAGSEAALVSLARSVSVEDADPVLAARLSGTGLASADLVVVVGGNDIGPRTWVEQLLPRVEGGVPLIAVAPTVLLPELLPYVESGQVDGLIGTAGDTAAYLEAVGPDAGIAAEDRPVAPLGLLLGLLVAILVLAQSLGERVIPGLRLGPGRP